MNEVEVFNYDSRQVRTVEKNGEAWFVGKDVAKILGYAKSENAIANHVDDEDKTTTLIQGTGSNYKSKTVIINESGLYSLIFASKLPTAKQFKHWVTSEVLPSIRKSGMYLTEQAADAYVNNPGLFAAMAERCSALERKVEAMERTLTARYSLSVLGETVLATKGAISVKDGASFLSQHGVPMGQNRLYEYCRRNKLLCSRAGRQYNKPTQTAIDAGLFNVEISGGFNAITLITPRGLKYLTDKLIAEHYPLIALIEARS